MRWFVIAFLVACGSSKQPPKNDFEAFDAKFVEYMRFREKMAEHDGKKINDRDRWRSYRGVYVGASGVWIDRRLIATLAELDAKRDALATAATDNVALMPTIGASFPLVTFDVDTQPAGVAIAVLRLFPDRETGFYVRSADPEAPFRAHELVCATTIRNKPSADRDRPNISVLFHPDRLWVGVSKILEFQDIPKLASGEHDFDKLEYALKDRKTTLFADRTDLELGATAGTSRDVLVALGVACKVGFHEVAFLDAAQLSAVPTL